MKRFVAVFDAEDEPGVMTWYGVLSAWLEQRDAELIELEESES